MGDKEVGYLKGGFSGGADRVVMVTDLLNAQVIVLAIGDIRHLEGRPSIRCLSQL